MDVIREKTAAGLVTLGLLFLAGCGGGGHPTVTSAPTLDPASAAGRGQALFRARCASCHAVRGDKVVIGPSLQGVASRAASRIPGQGAEDYLYTSILKPNAYTVVGFPEGGMQQDFAMLLTSEEVDDLVAYLLTLK